jgi:hypothetical protein
MKQISVQLDPEEKRLLMLEAYRFQLTLSKLLRVLLVNTIDTTYLTSTVETPTDPTMYFSLWGQRFILLSAHYFESFTRSRKLDNADLEPLNELRNWLPVQRAEDLLKESSIIKSGMLNFSVPNALYESIKAESNKQGVTRSDYIRDILRAYIQMLDLFYKDAAEPHDSFAKSDFLEGKEMAFSDFMQFGRQAVMELDSLSLLGVRVGEPFPPTQLQKRSSE